ncbi:kinase-like domain-containing protein [Lineolata rhizophorae]|uniref:Kinase-like domain-containing protein n=1 Tax=Lineolata rhizophorae TaxID=578093 RepID=A0A6A6P4U1_9PEZI|nr:kinase-like domain-containing protein [Lineolata rhizophorae]
MRTFERSNGLLPLRLPLKYNAEKNKTKETVQWVEASPWSFYKKVYRIELGGSVAVAHKKPNTKEQFTIKSVSASGDQIRLMHRLYHKNLLSLYEVFYFDDAFYTVSEHMAISLTHVIGCPEPLTEGQLASITKQCLCGISYLVSQGLSHTDITCPNILLSFDGVVKIGRAIMSVMNKRLKLDGNLSISNPGLWSTEAVEFLSMTLDAAPGELSTHSFLEHARGEDLPWFVIYTLRTARVIVATM